MPVHVGKAQIQVQAVPTLHFHRKNRDTQSLIPLESELTTASVGERNSWSRNSEGESAAVTGESVEIDVVSEQL